MPRAFLKPPGHAVHPAASARLAPAQRRMAGLTQGSHVSLKNPRPRLLHSRHDLFCGVRCPVGCKFPRMGPPECLCPEPQRRTVSLGRKAERQPVGKHSLAWGRRCEQTVERCRPLHLGVLRWRRPCDCLRVTTAYAVHKMVGSLERYRLRGWAAGLREVGQRECKGCWRASTPVPARPYADGATG